MKRIFNSQRGPFGLLLFSPLLLLTGCSGSNTGQDPMLSRFAMDVDEQMPWPEYPRPQMVRGRWLNLNGSWDYSLVNRDDPQPQGFAGQILVPFAIESTLSGVKQSPAAEQKLWYKRSFAVPQEWAGERVLLHFGAVDWHAMVYINGTLAGEHKGGYTPFSFDITDALTQDAEQELVVSVWDPTDTWTQARGKQVSDPGGIWYTSVTGIWQTVWLEPVPEISIKSVGILPSLADATAQVSVSLNSSCDQCRLKVTAFQGGEMTIQSSGSAGQDVILSIEDPVAWTPDSPTLYELDVQLLAGEDVVDRVSSYFAMRDVSLGKDSRGFTRLMLNSEPIFMFGPLDQGWWPDGLYTAPTDEALRYDIEVTRMLGFNMARKHVKVEPARWYYHCDRLGLMVWQDMPNGNLRRGNPDNLLVSPADAEDAVRPADSAEQFEAELAELIDTFSFFPSIVMWVPFNEGWGQYDTARISEWVENRDPSRLVNAISGWTDRDVGHVYDAHMYPGPGMEHISPERATLLGEFGGLGWPVNDHLWTDRENWGYRTYFSRDDLNNKYQEVVGNLLGPLGHGLAAAIYTQTTDVESEVNGLMTYDREIVKFDEESVQQLHKRIYEAKGKARTLLESSEHAPQEWEYRFDEPADGWAEASADVEDWQKGNAPFQSGDDSQFPTGTKWEAGRMWMMKTFNLESLPTNLWAEAYHAIDSGSLYLNGKKILDFNDLRPARRHYHHMDLSMHTALLQEGSNVIAVEGEFSEGRRGLDFGLYTVE